MINSKLSNPRSIILKQINKDSIREDKGFHKPYIIKGKSIKHLLTSLGQIIIQECI